MDALWIRAHTNVPGNERADKLSKTGGVKKTKHPAFKKSGFWEDLQGQWDDQRWARTLEDFRSELGKEDEDKNRGHEENEEKTYESLMRRVAHPHRRPLGETEERPGAIAEQELPIISPGKLTYIMTTGAQRHGKAKSRNPLPLEKDNPKVAEMLSTIQRFKQEHQESEKSRLKNTADNPQIRSARAKVLKGHAVLGERTAPEGKRWREKIR